MLRAVLLSSVLLFLTGCRSCCGACGDCAECTDEQSAASATENGAVALRPLARGGQSGLRAPRQIVVRSAEEWEALWREHAAERLPGEPLPVIDFTQETVVGVVLGDRPTAGYEVQILRIEREGERLVVHTRETTPAPGLAQAQVVTSPFDFIAVPRFEGEVVFTTE